MEKCCAELLRRSALENGLWRSVVEKCCEGVLWRSVVKECRGVAEKCCGEVL